MDRLGEVAALADIGTAQYDDEKEEDVEAEEERGEADEELDAEVAEAEAVLDQMMKAFTEPDAMLGLIQKLNLNMDLDATVPGGEGKTLRDLVAESAERSRRGRWTTRSRPRRPASTPRQPPRASTAPSASWS